MPGHPPRDGMDRVLDVDPRLEDVGELAHVVLGLRDRHAVPGTTMTLRANESWTATSRASSRARSGRRLPAHCPPLPDCPKAPKSTFAIERFIAFAMSSVRSVPGRADEHPRDDEHGRVEDEPGRGGSESGECVQQRDDDGMSAPPIGSTNMTPKRSASPMRPYRSHSSSTPAIAAMPSAAAPRRTTALTTFCPGKTIGRPLTSPAASRTRRPTRRRRST